MAVHAEGDFKSQSGVGEGASLGEDLTHDSVARSAEHLGDAGDLDVDRHRIDQLVVFLLNVRHAGQRSTTAIDGRRGTRQGMSVRQGRQRQTAPTRMCDHCSPQGSEGKRLSSACRSFGFRMEGPSEFGRRAAFRADGQMPRGDWRRVGIAEDEIRGDSFVDYVICVPQGAATWLIKKAGVESLRHRLLSGVLATFSGQSDVVWAEIQVRGGTYPE